MFNRNRFLLLVNLLLVKLTIGVFYSDKKIDRQQINNQANNTTETKNDEFIFIDFFTLDEIILAEPDTLTRIREASVSIISSRDLEYNVSIGWRIEPVDNKRFQQTDGSVLLAKNTNTTKFSIRTKNTPDSTLNPTVFKLFLQRVVGNINISLNGSSQLPIYITANWISIRILPANFPFGFFQFPEYIALNRTVSR